MSKLPMKKDSLVKTAVAVLTAICLISTGPVASYPARAQEKSNPLDIFIIVNRQVNVGEMSIDVVREYFLKKRTYWTAVYKAVAINSKDDALRDDFRTKVLNMTKAEEQRYWRNAKVKGTKTEPPAFPNTIRAVFKLKGSISYVYRKDFLDGVSKVVMIIPASQ